jgi:hypothetical protein
MRSDALRLLAAVLGLCALLPGCDRARAAPAAPAPPAAPESGRVIDIAERSGIAAFRHTDGGSGRKFFVEQMGSGVALFDYDRDGWLDIYLCSGAALPGYEGPKPSNRLFRNRRDGTFEDVTERSGAGWGHYSIGVAAGDYDNDGNPDLYVCGFGKNALFRNQGDGTFRDVAESMGVAGGRLSSSAAWGDYDGDGYLDLYVCNYVKYRLDEDLWCSKFAGHKSYCGPNLYEPEEHLLFHNDAGRGFTDVSKKAGIAAKSGNGLGCVWLDYDDDGDQDIFVANDQSPNFLWRNNGGGTFTEAGVDLGVAYGEQGHAEAGMGADAGDFDNDGLLDITVTNFSEESNSLYHNRKGSFREISFQSGMGARTLMFLGFGTAFLDYDRDGLQDLFFANGHVLDDIEKYSDSVTWAQSNQLFRNLGNGQFDEASEVTGVSEGKRVSRGAAFGDLFNDGRTHIVVNVLRGKPLLLKNECAPGANWLELDLRPSWGNPQAIGARVRLTAGGVTQRRDVKTGGSYASSSDPRPLFGLGAATQVDEVTVRWSSGQTTTIKGPPINRILRVDEPPPAPRTSP